MASAPSQPLAISLGDPAGIGPEVLAKCWDNRSSFNLPPFVAIGDGRSVAEVWDGPIEVIDEPSQADSAFDVGLPLIQISAAETDVPGHPSAAGAHCSLDSLELAVGLARSGSAAAVVTGPVAKEQLYSIGFAHPGQTEFVAERCGVAWNNVAMMLAGPSLRTVPVTTHRAFAAVPGELTTAIKISAHAFSEGAKGQIESAGGSIETLERTDRWVTARPRSRRLPLNRELKQAGVGKVGGPARNEAGS